ncbi:MAG: hypothetical protein CL472_00970 [Acidobacteria bacterium]|nr:hypothetical protein [Acidobacteriota bacterium]
MSSMNPFTTYGRTTRTLYMASIIALFGLWILMRANLTVFTAGEAFARVVLSLIILWPAYCVTVMRLHDSDRTSLLAIALLVTSILGVAIEATSDTLSYQQGIAYLLTAIISLTNLVCVVVISFFPPTRGANRYGADPRGKAGKAERAAELDSYNS